jgi:NAD(P)-dependent dehydrogenase (short-subunit alcohol dehydrogenase family)
VTSLLEGRVAIVTGASRGIGMAAAHAFAEAGAAVVLAARSAEALDAVAGRITEGGGRALAVATDMTDPAAVERLVEKAVTTFGRLDLAFNNAGSGHMPRPLAEMSFEEFEWVIKANLHGVFLGMRFEIPAMLAAGGGAIVNMSSAAGLIGAPGMGAYSAAKHGVVALTRTAAIDYGRRNIRVNALAPGPIENEQMAAGLTDERRNLIAGRLPMGRLGRTDEVARAAVWLCSDEASFITGAVLSIDGGRLAGGA